jgi:hypothetical protein
VPLWSPQAGPATSIELRRQYGRNFTVLETDNMFPTWGGTNAYYGIGVRPIGVLPGYVGVRDQQFELGPGPFVPDDVYVGTPSGMFTANAWTYGATIKNGVIAYWTNSPGLTPTELNTMVDALDGVQAMGPPWSVGTIRPEPDETIYDWLASLSPTPTETHFAPGYGGRPGNANDYFSWIVAFTPDPLATLGTWYNVMTVSGFAGATQGFIDFDYRLA